MWIEHVTYAEAVAVFQECVRTLKPRAWIHISVPYLSKYVTYYRGEIGDDSFARFPNGRSPLHS
jgi:predicted SAM-dependent methyltransferase